MRFLSRLFGTSPAEPAQAEPERYEGYLIYPEPISEGGKWRIGARIEKEIDGETKVHRLIRADMLDDRDTAAEVSVGKARQMIDQSGDRIFN